MCRNRYMCGVTVAGLLALASHSPQANAADQNGHFAIKGGGGARCAQYTKARSQRSPDALVYAGWIDGYLTARNESQADTYDLSPWQTTELLAGLLDQFCARYPEASFYAGVRQLAVALRQSALSTRSPLVQAEYDGQGTLIYAAILRRVQERLANRGLYDGPADGQFGPALRTALEQLQRSEGLAVTGLPDQRTLARLFDRPGG